jgi:hypothetical protein
MMSSNGLQAKYTASPAVLPTVTKPTVASARAGLRTVNASVGSVPERGLLSRGRERGEKREFAGRAPPGRIGCQPSESTPFLSPELGLAWVTVDMPAADDR